MRYVAHSNPDSLLYTLMIRGCSPPSGGSEPERALDLFTEMTVDRRLAPTSGAYSAVILACARSGTKEYVNEAFRLAKEMLDSHRDARGLPAFRPEVRTFTALLEGAKRVGDLARVRWILAELVRGIQEGADSDFGLIDAEINEEIMMHVFHAYAAYKPPFKRSAIRLVDSVETEVGQSATTTPEASQGNLELPSNTNDHISIPASPVEALQEPTFRHLPPQSRSEVIAEAEFLFNRILEERDIHRESKARSLEGSDGPFTAFHTVKLTARLVNSYLSVHYAHSPLDKSRSLFSTIFSQHNVMRNSYSYFVALERCAVSRRGYDREVMLPFAEEVWSKWQIVEKERRLPDGLPLTSRHIERVHTAMIRVLTLCAFSTCHDIYLHR